MLLSGIPVAATELARYGGILDVVPTDELLASARARAATIARHSPVAVRAAKASLNAIEFLDLKSGYAREQEFTAQLAAYSDSKEAVDAYLEDREPHFTGG
jgi:enoyl-CoA hydratase